MSDAPNATDRMGRWEIPHSWTWASAGEIAEVVGGGTPSTRDPTNFSKNGIPWITPADLTASKEAYISRGARDLSPKGYQASGAQIMPAGAVLFSSRAPIGYCVIAANEVSTNQGFKSLVLRDRISPEYVRHYLRASKDYAESLASGTTFKELSGSRMAELAVPIAPLAEQRRIAAKVGLLTGRTARARAELDRIPALIARYSSKF
jgi:type I restriction enzyme S subunit